MKMALVGRRLQPAALSLMLADAIVALTLMPGPPWHLIFHEAHGGGHLIDWMLHAVGLMAAACVGLFVWSWKDRDGRLLHAALQLSTLLWLCVAAIGVANGVAWDRSMFALCFAVLAGGSAWLEKGSRD